MGDIVRIASSNKKSKNKAFVVWEVLEKAKQIKNDPTPTALITDDAAGATSSS